MFIKQSTRLMVKVILGVHKTPNINDGYIGCGVYRQSDVENRKLPFHKAVKKYGYTSFQKYILSFYDTYSEALDDERYMVNEEWVKSSSNYNCAIGGRGSGIMWMSDNSKKIMYSKISAKLIGGKRSQESRDKISKSRKGKLFSEEHKKALSENNARFWKGKIKTEESKKKQSVICTGRKLSEYHRKMISEGKKGKFSPHAFTVIQYDLGMNFIKEHRSLPEAALFSGIPKSTIHVSIHKNRPIKNFVFKYK